VYTQWGCQRGFVTEETGSGARRMNQEGREANERTSSSEKSKSGMVGNRRTSTISLNVNDT